MHEAKTLLAIVDSYLTRRMHNMVVLNYEKLAANFYPIVVKNTKKVYDSVAEQYFSLFFVQSFYKFSSVEDLQTPYGIYITPV